MYSLLIEFIGLVAWLLITISYWQKKKSIFIIIQILSYFIYALHFYMLGGTSGVLCNLGGVIVLILLYIKNKINKPCYILIPVIISIFLIITISSYHNIYDLFPILASIIPLTSNWLKNLKLIKIGGIIGSICWIIYAFVVNSYVMIFTNIIFLISTCIALFKVIRDERKKV